MSSGAPLAQSSADMMLMGESLTPLADGLQLSRRTLSVIRQNLAWAVCYNLVALPLAAAGWVAPWMAAIGMSASSVLVILNSTRLARAPMPSGSSTALTESGVRELPAGEATR